MNVMESILRTYTNQKDMIKMGPSLCTKEVSRKWHPKPKSSLMMSKSFTQ